MLWVGILAGLALAATASEVITPTTKIHNDMKVDIKDEGATGLKHLDKPYPLKKATGGVGGGKKELSLLKATVQDEGAVGARLRESQGVPSLKHISFPVEASPHDESPDFDDEIVPAASSQTSRINVKKGPNGQEYEYEYVYYYYDDEEEGAGGKKAAAVSPGGGEARDETKTKEAAGHSDRGQSAVRQEQEIPARREPAVRQQQQVTEEEEEEEEASRAVPPPSRGVPPPSRAEPTIRGGGGQHHQQQESPRAELRTQELRQEERQSLRDEPHRHRGTESTVRYGLPEDELQPVRQRGSSGAGRRGRPEEPPSQTTQTRYTTIERGRVKAADSGVAVTTAEPSVNEVIPTRIPSRSRGGVSEPSEEDVPPKDGGGRFAGRSRSTTPAAPLSESQPPPSRSRQGGSVRRPSLVDSSSFRTQGSTETVGGGGANVRQSDFEEPPAHDKLGYLSPQLDTRESDFEEYIRPTTFQPSSSSSVAPPQTTLAPVQQPSSHDADGQMPGKAALDLYAILQQTQEENSVLEDSVLDGEYDSRTEGVQLEQQQQENSRSSSTEQQQTITTTPEPTTTTTTTTTTTPAPPATGRGRFRSSGGRTRLRPAGSGSTTTTQQPQQSAEEEAPKREKFKPSHNRNPGQVSAYGRRRGGSSTSTTEAAQTSTPRSRPSSGGFSSGSNRYRARTRTTPATPAHSQEEEQPSLVEAEAAPASTSPRPHRARLPGGARPLRPGPRLNLRGNNRPTEEQPQQGGGEEPAPVAGSAPAAPAEGASVQSETEAGTAGGVGKPRTRPKIKQPAQQQPAAPAPPQPRPFNTAIRRPLPGLRRRTTEAADVEPEVTTPSSQQPVETEPPSQPSTEPPALPQTTENRLSSLISRRRPLQRRIQPQPSQPDN